MEAQSFRLTCEDAPSIEYMARFIAKTQQRFTQRGGVRPFGVSSMIAGFASDNSPQLYLTDPAGTYSAWKVPINYFVMFKLEFICYSCVIKLSIIVCSICSIIRLFDHLLFL
jgi:hypothetical protein